MVDKSKTKSIKIAADTYRRLRLWKKVDESYPSAIHRIITGESNLNESIFHLYELLYSGTIVKFKVGGNDVYYWNSDNSRWENDILAWVNDDNADNVKEMMDFFKNFLLKKSAMILLDGMGDELVYGDYTIKKIE